MRNIKGYGDILKEQKSLDQKQLLDKALQKAAWVGDLEKAKELLDNGADPNTEDSLGWTPLTSAVTFKNLEIAELLLDRGADVNKQSGDARETPLHHATRSENANMVNLFLNRGADPNIKNVFGDVPLNGPSWSGNMKIVKMLMEHRADPNIKNNMGFTPLCNAIHDKYNKSKVSLLYGFGSATARNRGVRVAKFLILHGANPIEAFETFEDFSLFFGSDLSWYKGDLPALERRFRATETRRKLF